MKPKDLTPLQALQRSLGLIVQAAPTEEAGTVEFAHWGRSLDYPVSEQGGD